MTSQRVGGAESLTRHKLSNGPQRAQSNGGKCNPAGVFCDVGGGR